MKGISVAAGIFLMKIFISRDFKEYFDYVTDSFFPVDVYVAISPTDVYRKKEHMTLFWMNSSSAVEFHSCLLNIFLLHFIHY